MTLQPPALDQLKQLDGDRLEFCGETMLASALTYVGIPTTPEQVAVQLRAWGIGDPVQDGTSEVQLSRYLDSIGVEHEIWEEPSFAGPMPPFPIGVCVRDNSYANPDPAGPYNHWILDYNRGFDGNDSCMNPYGGRYVSYPWSLLMEKDVFVCAIVIRRLPVQPSVPPQEDDMSQERTVDHPTIAGRQDNVWLDASNADTNGNKQVMKNRVDSAGQMQSEPMLNGKLKELRLVKWITPELFFVGGDAVGPKGVEHWAIVENINGGDNPSWARAQ